MQGIDRRWWATAGLMVVSLSATFFVGTWVTGNFQPQISSVSKDSKYATDHLGPLTTISCKAATAAGYNIQCCAEAPSDAVQLTAIPFGSPAQNIVTTETESHEFLPEHWRHGDGRQISEVPLPKPRRGKNLQHVLVTGGAGYIGSHAALRLLEDGHAVTIVDNLSRGNIGAITALRAVAKPQQLRFLELDLGDVDKVIELFLSSKFDVVIHFAAVAYVAESYKDPLLYYKNVTSNTRHILEGMKAANVNRMVYSSTCATYGNPQKMPITETTPQQPVSPYGSAKFTSEQMIKEFSYSNEKFAAILLRYFNVIGSDPHGRIGESPIAEIAIKHGRISGACFNAALGYMDSLSIMGTDHKTKDGTTVRDYIHVVDLVDAHVRALQNFKESSVRVYNVGIGKGYSVREFVDACKAVTGVNITVIERERRPGDASIVFADPSKVKKELGWSPRFTDLRESLATAWNWTSKHPRGYSKSSI